MRHYLLPCCRPLAGMLSSLACIYNPPFLALLSSTVIYNEPISRASK
jgi:hypothetical protein